MIEAIGVVGAGTMGAGIAQVAAQAGISVRLRDLNDELVWAGLAAVLDGPPRPPDPMR